MIRIWQWGLIAWAFAAGSAEFDTLDELAGPPWAPKAAGFVDTAADVRCENGFLSFTMTALHSYMTVKLDKPYAAAELPMLRFRLDAPVNGRLTIYYIASDGTMAMMDQVIEVEAGLEEYEIDLSKQSFGRDYHSGSDAEGAYRRFGGATGQVTAFRVDAWFPIGERVGFDYWRLERTDDAKE